MLVCTFYVVIGVLALISEVLSCGPGNVADLGKIKTYMGSDVLPEALKTTAYSTKYVLGADDLNCDFEIPRNCKWTNAPRDNITDHNQFYLFKQTDEKVWWGIGILPGNSPSPGNSFILAGDKEAEGHGAVWYSNPIRCQKNTGTLKFSYWLYNQGKVDAVVLRPHTNPIEAIARPEQACSKFKPLGTQCVVSVPPIQEPFQLAIRAYDLKGSLGSLAMIDDIEYDADVCVDLFDLGPHFLITPLESAVRGDSIRQSSDLDCGNFDSSCRWGNALGNNIQWQSGRGPMDPEKWTTYTQTADPPFEPFAIIKTNGGIDGVPRGRLISDPIPCQGEFGSVTFRYWMSPVTQLRVCSVRLSNFEPIDCVQVSEFNSPGPRSIPIHGPIQGEFAIEFEALDFNGGEGGFVAIDDIEYKAKLCGNGKPNAELKIDAAASPPPRIHPGPPPTVRPRPVVPPLRPPPPSPAPQIPIPSQVDLAACKILTCDFEGNTMCGYRNQLLSTTDAQWKVFNTRLGSSGNVAVRRKARGHYLGTTLEGQSQRAILVSPDFTINRPMKLRFNYNRGTYGSGLWVCKNRLDPTLQAPNCARVAGPELTLDEWNGIAETSVDLAPADTKVYMIATNAGSRAGRAAFSLDNIRISFPAGGALC